MRAKLENIVMHKKDIRLDRRKFLKRGLQVTAGVMALGSGVAQAALPDKEKTVFGGGMPERAFGKTGTRLPVFGHGGSAMVKKWIGPTNCELLPEAERVAMVRHGFDRGIRYFDTARVYGESEKIMGQALKGVRDKVYLASKVAVYSPEDVRKSVEASLTELQTQAVDCMQLHSPTIEALGFEGAMKIHGEMLKLRDEGLFRHIGLTTHVAFETVHKMIKTGGFDQVLLARGYFNKGMVELLSDKNLEWREKCMVEADSRGMAIVVMKVMGHWILGHNAERVVSGYDETMLKKLPGAAIRWALQDERVSMLNIGVTIPGDIDENIEILQGDVTLTSEDSQLLADFTDRARKSILVRFMRVV